MTLLYKKKRIDVSPDGVLTNERSQFVFPLKPFEIENYLFALPVLYPSF